MPLNPGTRLGVYDVVSLLGAGGMGEVYRARDAKLNRDVAIKILPESFVADPERVARFEREAQLLASLNHPHIGAIYGLDTAGAIQFLVLELVEGETLADRIAAGPLRLEDALQIAGQIADALQAAHEKGIIHRDLKPANIALTHDGQVKVLDFGLAKVDSAASSGSGGLTHSPTITFAHTQAGVILGTAAYMSPEQAKGRAADKRSDIWAFGTILFEMLAGRRAFTGEDITDTITAIMRDDPDWAALPASTPAHIRSLIERCLKKDRQQRLADIAVAQYVMTEATVRPGVAAVPATARPRTGRLAWAAAAGLVLGLLGAAIAARIAGGRSETSSRPQPVRFAIVQPASQPFAVRSGTADRKVAISPDGTRIVYGVIVGQTPQFAVRALDELDAHLLGGSGREYGRDPFMSPDGRWIGYFSSTELRKVATSGGGGGVICKVAGGSRGASWGTDDTIVFAIADRESGVKRVAAAGGTPTAVSSAQAATEVGHWFPHMLPGNRTVLFTNAKGPAAFDIEALDLRSGARKVVLHGGSDARYVDSGHLVYAAGGGLYAVGFDLSRLETTGDPVLVVDHVLTESNGTANFDVSRAGSLVFSPGNAAQAGQKRSLVWVTRDGREEPIEAPQREYAIPRLSPDGTRVALDIRDQTNDIWIWDLARRTLTPLNLDQGLDMSPVWTPDGRRILWTSTRTGSNPNIYWQAADGTGAPERLTTSVPAQFPTSISPDGTRVAIYTGSGTGRNGLNLSLLSLDRSAAAVPNLKTESLIRSEAVKFNPEISPDGRWLAFQSDESGQFEIYVRPFPAVDGGRWPISPAGGTRPAWSRSGRELFYLDANDLLTAVPVQTAGATFTAGAATPLLKTRYYAGATSRGYDLRGYDVSPDGRRFLMIKDAVREPSQNGAPALVVVVNWSEELKQRGPGRAR